ncbi:MAG: hypothetical protein KGM99_13155 [Burkholderiales bacterium]|nr:hypothetical protein [Burkholderiales bacterium]
MKIHIVPVIRNPYADVKVLGLKSIHIAEFGIQLNEDQLTLGKPYPNKNFIVGRLKKGRKAESGIMFEIPDSNFAKLFNVEYQWRIELRGREQVLNHQIKASVIGELTETSALISFDAMNWHAVENLPNKFPEEYKNLAPIRINPRFDLEIDFKGGDGIHDKQEAITLPVIENVRTEQEFLADYFPVNRFVIA